MGCGQKVWQALSPALATGEITGRLHAAAVRRGAADQLLHAVCYATNYHKLDISGRGPLSCSIRRARALLSCAEPRAKCWTLRGWCRPVAQVQPARVSGGREGAEPHARRRPAQQCTLPREAVRGGGRHRPGPAVCFRGPALRHSGGANLKGLGSPVTTFTRRRHCRRHRRRRRRRARARQHRDAIGGRGKGGPATPSSVTKYSAYAPVGAMPHTRSPAKDAVPASAREQRGSSVVHHAVEGAGLLSTRPWACWRTHPL